MELNTTGGQNTANGYQSLESNTTGNYNTAFGKHSLRNSTTGSSNSSFGIDALYQNTTGGSNTAIGRNAGGDNTTGSGNIFIGYGAGDNSNHQTSSNKLVIANSSTNTPLIDGDFNESTLKVNGSLEVTGSITKSVGALQTVYSNGDGDSQITVNAPLIPVEPVAASSGTVVYITLSDGSFDGQELALINTTNLVTQITNTASQSNPYLKTKQASNFVWYSNIWWEAD